MKVLYIEDDQDDVLILKNTFTETNIEYTLACRENLKSGIEYVSNNQVDLILLDLGLPDNLGLEAITELQRVNAQLPIIVVTDDNDEEFGVRAIHYGAQDYLIKGRLNAELLSRSIRYSLERQKSMETVKQSEIHWRNTFNSLAESVVVLSRDGFILESNPRFFEMLELEGISVAGKQMKDLHSVLQPIDVENPFQQVSESKEPLEYFSRHNGYIFKVSLNPILQENSEVVGFVHVMRDVTKEQLLSEREKLTATILEILNESPLLEDAIGDVVNTIEQALDLDAVAIRLHDGDDYPFLRTKGYEQNFLESENSIVIRGKGGKNILDATGNPKLHCICGRVLSGNPYSVSEFFTDRGSFWTNAGSHFLNDRIQLECEGDLRLHCFKAGYESLAIIPLLSGKSIVGLMQLHDHKQDRFSLDLVQFLEGLGASIGIALSRITAEKQLRTSLVEKDTLLQEVHHRVKNNMQIILSLLNLKANEIEDPSLVQAFTESRNRIYSMALVHEKLYKSENFKSVDFKDYITSLIHELIILYECHGRIEFFIEVNTLDLDIEHAVPCGLIVNELVTNALKYAFPDNSRGSITIQFNKDNSSDVFCLIIKDDGVGLPEGFPDHKPNSLGHTIVQVLADQLMGEISFHSHKGTEVRLSFPQS
jgi:PAS domain S-box-containing protein